MTLKVSTVAVTAVYAIAHFFNDSWAFCQQLIFIYVATGQYVLEAEQDEDIC